MAEELAANALIVFARAPMVGRTKTRLIQAFGATQAAEIYAALLSVTLCVAEAIDPVQRYLYVDSESALNYFSQRLKQNKWKIAVQKPGDLGVRMSAALTDVLANHSNAALIGSDIVDLRARDLIDALTRLANTDEVVIGPAADGGYWLIGMREVTARLFADIAWGTQDVYRDTLAYLDATQLAWSALPLRHDIDTAQDVRDWDAEIQKLREKAVNFPVV